MCSHELRTPIAGIIGLLDLLSCDSLTSEQEFSVSQIRRCATGLLSLVNNVLDISKVIKACCSLFRSSLRCSCWKIS